MSTKRKKQAVGLALDKELLDKLDAWRESQDVVPTKTACLEAAIKEFLAARCRGRKRKAR